MSTKHENNIGRHIYITSDEEIKIGDWVYCLREGLEPILKQKVNAIGVNNDEMMKKIILTTDKDLITDGVQAIDDEFLEWFVKNPSCEEIGVEKVSVMNDRFKLGYKIIIPKEEPKQEKPEEVYLDSLINEANKEFTLDRKLAKEVAIKFAKWQQERMYSEEEVIAFGWLCREKALTNVDLIFEQFRKK